MEQDQEMIKFVCKLCDKKFSCAKSLNGHMKSHVVFAESDEKLFMNNNNTNSNINDKVGVDIANGYGLRENPKKTWRAVDSNAPLEKVCKQCGKGFQSLKALCGHMACHSDKDRAFKEDSSWTSENQKMVLDSFSDTEEGDETRVRTRSAKGKKHRKVMEKCGSFSFANNGSSSVTEVDGFFDQEEVAICLMMLSRDSGHKSVVESSDNNSVVLETKSSSLDMKNRKNGGVHCELTTPESGDLKVKGRALDGEFAEAENSDSGYFLDECAKAESDVSVDGFRFHFRNGKRPVNEGRGDGYRYEFRKGTNRSKNAGTEYYDDSNFAGVEFSKDTKNSAANGEVAQKRTKYECMNCGKVFKSFQALGGHRPCHKRINTYYESTYESGENSLEDSTDYKTTGKVVESAANRKSSAKNLSLDKKNKSKKNKPHVCPFCSRVFKNGQALGGHKRSHFLGGHEETISHVQVKKPELPDFIDLNLPAPEENEEGQFFQW